MFQIPLCSILKNTVSSKRLCQIWIYTLKKSQWRKSTPKIRQLININSFKYSSDINFCNLKNIEVTSAFISQHFNSTLIQQLLLSTYTHVRHHSLRSFSFLIACTSLIRFIIHQWMHFRVSLHPMHIIFY